MNISSVFIILWYALILAIAIGAPAVVHGQETPRCADMRDKAMPLEGRTASYGMLDHFFGQNSRKCGSHGILYLEYPCIKPDGSRGCYGFEFHYDPGKSTPLEHRRWQVGRPNDDFSCKCSGR